MTPHNQPEGSGNRITATDNKWDDSEFHPRQRTPWWQRQRRELLMLAGLGLALLAVVVWLPTLVTPKPPEPASVPASGADTGTAPPAPVSAPATSPWQDAQLAKARRQAQEILARLLERQSELEAQQVRLWAADKFAAALQQAEEGDRRYRQRQFARAQSLYETALGELDSLLERADQHFQQTLTEGLQAIEAQRPADALAAFQLAVAMRPDNEKARAGLARAEVQEAVIEHLDQAGNALLQQQYSRARTAAEAALQLDPQSRAAGETLQQVQRALAERDFASAMGRGYSQLQAGDFGAAIDSFRAALSIRPEDTHAATALQQARNRQTRGRIQTALTRAAELERSEDWSQALAQYQNAQQLDDSLVEARIGLLRSRARAELDQQLQTLLENPLRLSDPAVYGRAEQLLQEARSVKPRGPRIERQQQQLQQTLAAARVPVTVQLRSDNATRVTLYRVGELGRFEQHSLQLTPGRYTLVGSRDGYRDVRKEFVIQPGSEARTIVIRSDEKISMGR